MRSRGESAPTIGETRRLALARIQPYNTSIRDKLTLFLPSPLWPARKAPGRFAGLTLGNVITLLFAG